MDVERAVEEPAPRASCTIALDRINRRCLNTWIGGQAEVVVRPGHDHFLSVNDGSRAFVALERTEVRVQVRSLDLRIITRRIEEPMTLREQRRFYVSIRCLDPRRRRGRAL